MSYSDMRGKLEEIARHYQEKMEILESTGDLHNFVNRRCVTPSVFHYGGRYGNTGSDDLLLLL